MILEQKCLNGKQEVPHRNTILQLSTPYTIIPPPAPHLLNHRQDVDAISQITSKHTLNKQTAKISTSGIAIVSILGLLASCFYSASA